MRARLHDLLKDSQGATVLEFAILAPVLFAMMFGVLQIGLGMQAYNSLRSIAGDTARTAVTAYQIRTDPDAATIQNFGRAIATAPPYSLLSDDLTMNVEEADEQRVEGAKEFTISINYNVPSILSVIGIEYIPISYSRPIFVIDNS